MIQHIRTFHENVKDAFHFAISDKVSLIVIGIILTIIGTMEEFHTTNFILSIVVFIVLIILLLFEAGYSSKIIEETLEGSTKPPIIENIFEILKHGSKEFIVLLGYTVVSFILGMTLEDIYKTYPNIVFLFILLFVMAILVFVMNSALIYMGHKQGRIKDGFNIKGIFDLYKKLGVLGTLFLFITCIISQTIVISSVFDVYSFDLVYIIDFIINFTLAPISLIFSLRLFALHGRLD